MKNKSLILRLMGGAFLASFVMAQTPAWSITTKSVQTQQQQKANQAAVAAVGAAAAANAHLIFADQAAVNAVYQLLHDMQQHHPNPVALPAQAARTAGNLLAYAQDVQARIGDYPQNLGQHLHADTRDNAVTLAGLAMGAMNALRILDGLQVAAGAPTQLAVTPANTRVKNIQINNVGGNTVIARLNAAATFDILN